MPPHRGWTLCGGKRAHGTLCGRCSGVVGRVWNGFCWCCPPASSCSSSFCCRWLRRTSVTCRHLTTTRRLTINHRHPQVKYPSTDSLLYSAIQYDAIKGFWYSLPLFQWIAESARTAHTQQTGWQKLYSRRFPPVERPSTKTTTAGTVIWHFQTIIENLLVWRPKRIVTVLNSYAKNVVLMDIINSLLKTGNKTADINVKKTAVYTHC